MTAKGAVPPWYAEWKSANTAKGGVRPITYRELTAWIQKTYSEELKDAMHSAGPTPDTTTEHWKPTERLRFVNRVTHFGQKLRILQQQWKNDGQTKFEWRDIPLETEVITGRDNLQP